MTITVSTDGSALGNPNGPMGWAWADHTPHAGGTPGHEHEGDCDAGGASNGTNQIGELCAVLEALRAQLLHGLGTRMEEKRMEELQRPAGEKPRTHQGD